MKILLVEDEDRSARQTMASIAMCAPGSGVTLANCRDEALELISSEEFDLIICDLRIPPTANSADIDEKHGLDVHARARSVCPGTPTIFLTAFATHTNTRQALSFGGVGRVYAFESYPLVQLITKDEVEELERVVEELHSSELALESNCAVLSASTSSEMMQRAVRMYACASGHDRAELHLASGLSGAATGRVKLTSPNHVPANIFVKVLPRETAEDEYRRFNRYVPNRLAPGYFAPALPPMLSGLRKQAALISTLATSDSLSLFDLIRQDVEAAAAAVNQLSDALAVWRTESVPIEMELGELRRERVSDERLLAAGVDLKEFETAESRTVLMRRAIAHGDLHGENILIDTQSRPLLIDFGDVGDDFAVNDPVVLETSLAFHRSGPLRAQHGFHDFDWSSWLDFDLAHAHNFYAPVIRAARRWGESVDSEPARCAMYYAHCMRQVKYGEIPIPALLDFARSCLENIFE